MHVPISRERVYWRGGCGIYLVLSVDRDKSIADLLPLRDGPPELAEDVPFDELEATGDEWSRPGF